MTMSDKLILFNEFKISPAEADMNRRLKIGSLVNYLIQSAINSSEQLGFGFEKLLKQNLFWVFYSLTVQIFRPLNLNEKIIVETWPKDIKGLQHLRDFIVRDEKEEIVIRATTGWLAIDFETKRPTKNINSMSFENFTRLKDKHGIKDGPVKLKTINPTDEFDIKTSYFDIDLNQHVTSTRYIDWMADTFSSDYHRMYYPDRLSVNYLKEVKLLQTLKLKRETIAENSFLFEAENFNNTVVFKGSIDFKKV